MNLAGYRRILRAPYIDYCQTVSQRTMAISIETAAYVWWTCRHRKATSAVDLGSGFTSYVLRRAVPHAVSVDDSPEWLAKTGEFLTRNGLSTDGLVSWDDWLTDPGTFDVVVHDFARGELRESSMWNAAEAVNPGGVLIFDDAQHEGHQAEMHRVCEAYGWNLYDIRSHTEDMIHRFAAMAAA